jgi:hypothetical protein
MQLVVSSPRFVSDEIAKGITDALTKVPGLTDGESAVVYYDFPVYSDYEQNLTGPTLRSGQENTALWPYD